MKIKISKSILENLLAYSVPFIEKKDESAITSHIYIESSASNTLLIKATDNEIGLNIQTSQLTIDEPGIATANGKKLLDIVRILKDGEIDIQTSANTLTIKQDHSLFKLPMFNASEYPQSLILDDELPVNIDSKDLISSLKKISPAIDSNNPKFELNGALIDFKDNKINFAATDTRRLAVVEIESQTPTQLSLIIPKKAILEIQKLFCNNISIYYNQTNLMIKSDQFTFFTKLINGQFPEFKRIIPTSTRLSITLNKSTIIDAIKQITTVSQDIKITFESDQIQFDSLNEDNIKASTQIESKTDVDETFLLAFNSRYILDFLSHIDEQTFTIELNEPTLPFVLKSQNFKTVIMPIII